MYKKLINILIFKLERLTLIYKWRKQSNNLYKRALRQKKCFFGPFLGEFGHLLGHNLPFVAHLYSKGVSIHYYGLEIHKPFFYSDNDKLLVEQYTGVRDFFSEHLPDCNSSQTPMDVSKATQNFIEHARKSDVPFFDNLNSDYYLNFFRWWVLKKRFIKTYDLSLKYKTLDEDSCVIFPRKWNDQYTVKQLKNNGEVWDYQKVALTASKHFDKIYVVGHPAFSYADFESFNNVEVILTDDNSVILEKCSNSKLIISQHSGSVYLGEYTNCQVLIIYKGSSVIGDIEITDRFKKGLGMKFDFNYAFDLQQIEDYLINFKQRI